jgi:outer membrane protein assembly factor BamD (BamD/ComL family)
LPFSFCLATGCVGLPSWKFFDSPKPPPPPVQDLVLRDGRLEDDPAVKMAKTSSALEGAKDLFRRADYVTAEKVFHGIVSDTKNSPQVAEEALYYEAESLRLQGYYPKAADTYSKLLKEFPSGQFRDQSNQRLFDIANYWLDDTRADMDAARQGKSHWWLLPVSYVHFDKTKPLLDEEGWALEKLEEIRNDMTGPLADKAMFYVGSVKFFNKEYREADQSFCQLTEMHPNSPLAPQALKMAIICKQLSTGGSDYDGRKTAEARQLIDNALRAYPELARKEHDFLMRQLYCINQQQADKDLKIAEFYRRTGHPGSAYFYYELVRRRYPGTTYFDKATQGMHELRGVLEKSEQKAPALPPVAQAPPGNGGPSPAPVAGSPLIRNDTGQAPRQLPPTIYGNR